VRPTSLYTTIFTLAFRVSSFSSCTLIGAICGLIFAESPYRNVHPRHTWGEAGCLSGVLSYRCPHTTPSLFRLALSHSRSSSGSGIAGILVCYQKHLLPFLSLRDESSAAMHHKNGEAWLGLWYGFGFVYLILIFGFKAYLAGLSMRVDRLGWRADACLPHTCYQWDCRRRMSDTPL
jgi:hypothetical protein